MSVVTNLILSFSSVEQVEQRIKDVNSFSYNGGQLNLVSIDYNKDKEMGALWYGGNKFFEGISLLVRTTILIPAILLSILNK